MYQANNNSTEGRPHDLFSDDPAAFQRNVRRVIDDVGAEIQLESVNKAAWHLAVRRSSSPLGVNGLDSALWLHYAAGGRHGHRDGMNLGFFAKGLDLLPDFGYPVSSTAVGGREKPNGIQCPQHTIP